MTDAPRTPPLLSRLRSFALRPWAWLTSHLSDWIEAYFWLPVVMIGVIWFHFWVREVDPTSGSDGLGALSGYAMLGVEAILIAILTWIFKKGMFGVLPRRHVRDIQEQVLLSDHKSLGANALLRTDRLEWLACLLVATYIFS